jgi:outer membrane protein assembly factor BamB
MVFLFNTPEEKYEQCHVKLDMEGDMKMKARIIAVIAIIIISIPCVQAVNISPPDSKSFPSVQPWSMFHHDLNHTGRSDYDTSANIGNEVWHYSVGSSASSTIYSSPSIGPDGTVYLGSNNCNFFALNPGGSLKWAFPTGGPIISTAAVGSDGTIYVGSGDHKLYAINPDGTKKWEFPTPYATKYGVASSPAIGPDGTVYFGCQNNKLYAVHPDGSLKWESNGYTVSEWSSPAISTDGILYIDSTAVYSENGTFKWKCGTGSVVWSSPAIGSDGTIFVGCNDNKLYAINPDGTKKWDVLATSGGYGLLSSPAIGNDGTIYVGSGGGTLYAMNPDKTVKWMTGIGGNVQSSPAIGSDGTIYIASGGGTSSGRLYAITPDGKYKWNFPMDYAGDASPAIGTDGTVYIASGGSKLYAIGTSVVPEHALCLMFIPIIFLAIIYVVKYKRKE